MLVSSEAVEVAARVAIAAGRHAVLVPLARRLRLFRAMAAHSPVGKDRADSAARVVLVVLWSRVAAVARDDQCIRTHVAPGALVDRRVGRVLLLVGGKDVDRKRTAREVIGHLAVEVAMPSLLCPPALCIGARAGVRIAREPPAATREETDAPTFVIDDPLLDRVASDSGADDLWLRLLARLFVARLAQRAHRPRVQAWQARSPTGGTGLMREAVVHRGGVALGLGGVHMPPGSPMLKPFPRACWIRAAAARSKASACRSSSAKRSQTVWYAGTRSKPQMIRERHVFGRAQAIPRLHVGVACSRRWGGRRAPTCRGDCSVLGLVERASGLRVMSGFKSQALDWNQRDQKLRRRTARAHRKTGRAGQLLGVS